MGSFWMNDDAMDKVIDYRFIEDDEDMSEDERREWDHDPEDCHVEDCPYCEPDYREKGY